jgi:hypothetical protein
MPPHDDPEIEQLLIAIRRIVALAPKNVERYAAQIAQEALTRWNLKR